MTSGCGFLTVGELEQALSGNLKAARVEEFSLHARQGCGACLLLAADMEVFQRVTSGGARDAESRESDSQARDVRERLKEAIRRRRTITS